MPIRPARFADLLPGSKILTEGFANDRLFKYLAPGKDQYPEEAHLIWYRLLRSDLYDPRKQILVSYSIDEKTGEEDRVTGIALWERKYAIEPPKSLYTQAVLKGWKIYSAAEKWLYPDRSADPKRLETLNSAKVYYEHVWSGSRADGYYLALIGVDPNAEKRGYGRDMVQWGFDRAREEGVVCSVISAPGRERFYRNCGFDVQLERTSDNGGDQNPVTIAGLQGGTIFFCDMGIEPSGILQYSEK